MIIDLTKLKVQPSLLEEPKEVDANDVIADLIWKECAKNDIQKANFALKLLNTKGEIEITKEEASYIMETTSVMKYWLAKALEDLIKSKMQEEIEKNENNS